MLASCTTQLPGTTTRGASVGVGMGLWWVGRLRALLMVQQRRGPLRGRVHLMGAPGMTMVLCAALLLRWECIWARTSRGIVTWQGLLLLLLLFAPLCAAGGTFLLVASHGILASHGMPLD